MKIFVLQFQANAQETSETQSTIGKRNHAKLWNMIFDMLSKYATYVAIIYY